MKTEVVLKFEEIDDEENISEFNENRSCIEITYALWHCFF